MTIHIALLRAVNLGPHRRIAMADLRGLLETLGFAGVRSLLQSGNLVFDSDDLTAAPLEQSLEEAAKRRLGLETDVFVRSLGDWESIVARNPFPEQAAHDPAHLLVMLLKTAPRGTHVTALRRAITGREVLRVAGRHAYMVYPDGIAHSRLTHAMIEAKLGTRGTARNWNTVARLGALAREQ